MTCCAACETRAPEAVGVLCRGCASQLVIGERRAPGIVTAREVAPAAWLIDAWGQLHAIPAPCRVGRDRERCDVVIADLSVSAEHAELRRDRDGWRVRDRGSSNGTSVGARARAKDAALPHRERIRFGSIGFVFWADATPPASEVPAPDVRTIVPATGAYQIESGEGVRGVLRAARGHPLARAPGELEIRDASGRARRIALPRLQFQLLRALCEAAVEAADDQRSAYVGSHELAATLPFQSPAPAPNHVRQVVATLRTTLERAELARAALVEAREGLGYRITWKVEPLGAEPA
jgi:hypothetical protein